jgi:putative DNA methylase
MSSSTPLFDYVERESGRPIDDLRLIEAGFPCHQVGAETQRERNTGQAPPTHRLHVWWARRPLTPSRSAILGATLPADADINEFLKSLGIVKPVAQVPGGGKWTLVNDLMLRRIQWDEDRSIGILVVDATVRRHFINEVNRRAECLRSLNELAELSPSLAGAPVLQRWMEENRPFPTFDLNEGDSLAILNDVADSAAVQDRIEFAKSEIVNHAVGKVLNIDKEDLYGYDRAFATSPPTATTPFVVLDPTAGGGSIPFEALRLGHHVISNELNPVATVIQYATLDFPRRFGLSLAVEIKRWGEQLISSVGRRMAPVTPFSDLPDDQMHELKQLLHRHPEVVPEFSGPEVDQNGLIYCREVTCPHCGGRAPLLNCLWLSKLDADRWAVRLQVRSKSRVDIEVYKLEGSVNRQLAAELDAGTVTAGQGTCVHCRQVIDSDEIKAQARAESSHGKMVDRLYCVVGFRYEPKLKKNGDLDRYTSGSQKGEIKSRRKRFFRVPNKHDFEAIRLAEITLQKKWDHFERLDLIPTEDIPPGHKTGDEGGAGSGTDKPLKLGTTKWHQMFTSRQLLGHLYLMEGLHELKEQILKELGDARGKAVITYLQFVIDKGLDWNSRQTCWIYQRGQVGHTFARHDFGFRWTFGEMIFSGPNSGTSWALDQIVDAYTSLAELSCDVPTRCKLEIINGSGARMESIEDQSVDLVVNDPPYYNNVMYSELADFFYVWQKRSLRDLYPALFNSYLTDKQSEAVANPFRDGSASEGKDKYERLMREMYTECHRVTKAGGRMVLMFTHKSQAGWETLTQALVNSGWAITATYPVESEFGHSMHIMEQASASSSIFIVCRKRNELSSEPALWKAFGGRGVQQRIIEEVQQGLAEFEALNLRPVDTMVACYGRALRVLSEKWPVLDGDETVSPTRALNEASRVVAQHQIHKLTEGRLKVEDLTPEAAMAVTLYGIAGLQPIRFDEVLNVARSLGIAIESTTAGYDASGRTIGYVTDATGRRAGQGDDIVGYHAPLVRKGSNLRLAKPEERNERRLASPQHEWDVMQGLILKYREGDIPVARAYLTEHAENDQSKIIDLLRVWTKEMDEESLRKEGEMMLFGLQR